MKKIILLILGSSLFLLTTPLFALKIELADNTRFYLNDGPKVLPTITITAESNNEITAKNGFNLLLSEDSRIRFDGYVTSAVTYSGSAASYIIGEPTIDSTLCTLHFNV